MQFAAGWWIWIDACVYSAVTDDPKKVRSPLRLWASSVAFERSCSLNTADLCAVLHSRYCQHGGRAHVRNLGPCFASFDVKIYPHAEYLRINALSWAQINGTDNGFWAEGTNTKAK